MKRVDEVDVGAMNWVLSGEGVLMRLMAWLNFIMGYMGVCS